MGPTQNKAWVKNSFTDQKVQNGTIKFDKLFYKILAILDKEIYSQLYRNAALIYNILENLLHIFM
jgi:hypothetical protein